MNESEMRNGRRRPDGVGQGCDGTLRARLLGEPQEAVQDQDRADDERIEHLADGGRDHRRGDEQPDERIAELAERDPKGSHVLAARDDVGPGLGQPPAGLGLREPARPVGDQPLDDAGRLQRV
jgi:hypothetical protein